MSAVRFESKPEPRLIATDGRMIASVPCELDENEHTPESALIDVECLKQAEKAGRKDRNGRGSCVALNGSARAPHAPGAPEFAYLEGEFPKWRDVMPKQSEKRIRIAFNAEYLYRLAQALGASDDVLELSIDPAHITGPILVRATNGTSAEGALMPVTVER